MSMDCSTIKIASCIYSDQYVLLMISLYMMAYWTSD